MDVEIQRIGERGSIVAAPMIYGKELIIDIHECDVSKFNRESLTLFFGALCQMLNMEPEDLHFWDYEGEEEEYEKAPDHLKGISAIQFIKTSNITIHTLDVLERVYLNVFSCKEYDHDKVLNFVRKWFSGFVKKWNVVDRI